VGIPRRDPRRPVPLYPGGGRPGPYPDRRRPARHPDHRGADDL